METFGGSVQLMFIIYALAAVISLATAWIIKLIFFAIQMQKKAATVPQNAKTRPTAAPADAPAKRTT
ncbi:MAG: hypothetical protein WCD56_00995 [Pseudolabrys sp.]